MFKLLIKFLLKVWTALHSHNRSIASLGVIFAIAFGVSKCIPSDDISSFDNNDKKIETSLNTTNKTIKNKKVTIEINKKTSKSNSDVNKLVDQINKPPITNNEIIINKNKEIPLLKVKLSKAAMFVNAMNDITIQNKIKYGENDSSDWDRKAVTRLEKLNFLNNYISKNNPNMEIIKKPTFEFSDVFSTHFDNFGVFVVQTSWHKSSEENLVIINFNDPSDILVINDGHFDVEALSIKKYNIDKLLGLVRIEAKGAWGTGIGSTRVIYIPLEPNNIGNTLKLEIESYSMFPTQKYSGVSGYVIELKEQIIEDDGKFILLFDGNLHVRRHDIEETIKVGMLKYEWSNVYDSFLQISGPDYMENNRYGENLESVFEKYIDPNNDWFN